MRLIKPIPFFLVTGFLGSGKTTFLKKVLHQLSASKRIAVIQNEFASSSTDGEELKQTGKNFKLVEINNGSVFCVCLIGNFPKVIQEVLDNYDPEMIFLEASGLSDPINILELIHDNVLQNRVRLERIVSIIDALNFEKALKMLTRTRHQVMIADTVFLNKTEEVSNTGELLEILRSINPYAELIPTSYCEVDAQTVLAGSNLEHKAAKTFGKTESEGRPDIKVSVLKTNDTLSEKALEEFISDLQGSCPRIKGFMNLKDGRVVIIQSVFENFQYEEIEGYAGPSEIVAFGEEMSPRDLRKKFQHYNNK